MSATRERRRVVARARRLLVKARTVLALDATAADDLATALAKADQYLAATKGRAACNYNPGVTVNRANQPKSQ